MSDNKESRAKLVECAKKEFLEKGYAKASLRKIAADAGLTTGAVYFFFGDKNGLFEGVVGEALQKLIGIIDTHFSNDMEEDFLTYKQQDGDHDEFAKQLVDVIYDNFDEMNILLNGAAGSKYEHFVDGIIDRMDKVYIQMAQRFAAVMPGKRVNKKILHWLCHVQINAFLHMIEHEPDKESAMRFIRPVMDLMIKAWIGYALEDAE